MVHLLWRSLSATVADSTYLGSLEGATTSIIFVLQGAKASTTKAAEVCLFNLSRT